MGTMSKTDKRISLLNRATQLKRAEARVKALSQSARTKRGKGFLNHLITTNKTDCFPKINPKVVLALKKQSTRQKRGKGILDHIIKTNCFGTNPKINPSILLALNKKSTRQKRGKGWGNLAALGLTTAAKGLWDISSAGKQKRYRDQEALNKIQQDYYANHYHR